MNKQSNRKASAAAPQVQAPIRLGSSHGYAFSGDSVRLNADLELPAYSAGGSYGLELWACSQPCAGVDPAEQRGSVCVARLELGLPTPLAPLVHHVEADLPAHLPRGGSSYVMTLVLVHEPAQKQRSLLDVASYAQREVFPGPQFDGDVSYEIVDSGVLLRAQSIANWRAAGNLSGTLALELCAYEASAEAEPRAAQTLARFELEPILGGYFQAQLACTAPLTLPPPGHWHTALLLREWTASAGFVTRDQRVTADLEVPAPRQATPAPAPVPKRNALLSLQTASIEQLTRIEGMSGLAAKELIKARPLRSWDDVLKVRGIGPATLKKLKAVATLALDA